MSESFTRVELRERFKKVRDMIEKERATRETVLGRSPLLEKKLAECDEALAALIALGNALANLLPPDAPVPIQERLFDLPERLPYRVRY